MTANPGLRAKYALRICITSLAFCLSTAAWAADYGGLVNQAREQLQDERFIEALASAKDAVRANANDYKGYYYVAMSYMSLNRFDEAEVAVKRARSLAPDSAKAALEKLANSINSRRQGAGSVQAADAAKAEGMLGKAARLYEQAWNAGQNNFDLGLLAADLYANHLNQPLDAARLLRQVKSKAHGNPAADKATAELAKMADNLRLIANNNVKASRGVSCDKALAALQQAEDADPSLNEIYIGRAQCAAQDNMEGFQNTIKELARHKLAKPDVLVTLPRMDVWMAQPVFVEFLGDLLGKVQLDELKGMLQSVDMLGTDMVAIPGKNVEIGKFEVTQGQWRAIMGNNPSHYNHCGDNCPVEQVSWDDIQTFLQKTGNRYRLPTEAEWEFACYGGSQSEYCGSNDINAVAWYEANSNKTIHAVGQKQANGYGLFDMTGNVWEWVSDCYDGDCAKRVLRGGALDGKPPGARAALRLRNAPASWFFGFGFRLARTTQAAPAAADPSVASSGQ
jgi:tetratricopeptide (TPR) repeat protein